MSKEALRSSTASVILSQTPDFRHESQLFTELHLAKIEKMFKDNVNVNEGKAALGRSLLAFAQGGTQYQGYVVDSDLSIFALVSPLKLFIVL